MRTQSTLLIHATIVTVDPQQTVWLDGSVLINADRIVSIDKTDTLLHSPHLAPDTRIVDCAGKIIVPGFINTHAHLAQSILRGLAENVPLHTWLCDTIWPLEANYGEDDGYVAARLTIAEMLRSGTTCFLEAMLTHRSGFENVVRAVEEMGIRGCLGKLVKVEETNTAIGMTDPRDRDVSSMSIEAALTAHENYHGACGGRVQVWMAAGTPRGSSESAHKAIGDACMRHNIGLTMHCAEAPEDLSIFHDAYSCSPIEFCERTNLIGEGRCTVLAHMVNLDLDKDLLLLHRTGATVAHNPSSNCKLASGIAAVPQMLAEKINVSLGTDGAPCANTYDMIQEMRLAALIQKGIHQNAQVMSADEVLAMATINGAKALGLDHDIGSLEPGKKADLVVIDPSGLHCAPFDAEQITRGGVDPITTVVYSCTGADVGMVMVDGQILVENRKLVNLDETQIALQARKTIERVRGRAQMCSEPSRKYR